MHKSIFAVAVLGAALVAPQAQAHGHGHGRGYDPLVPFVVGAVTGVVVGQAIAQPREERVVVERRYYAPPPPRVRVVKRYYYERPYPPPYYHRPYYRDRYDD